MSPRVTIIDYGIGNIKAFYNLYKRQNISVSIAKQAKDLKGSNRLILPGVGSFDWAMQKLNQSGMNDELNNLVLNKKLPVLGICVGMQMMANSSEEGKMPGLGWINGKVKRFEFKEELNTINLPLPHMGWNDVRPARNHDLFNDLKSPLFYFLHSYYFCSSSNEDILARSEYGVEFTCAAIKDNVIGVQFHPEKSHQYGMKLLKNFSNI